MSLDSILQMYKVELKDGGKFMEHLQKTVLMLGLMSLLATPGIPASYPKVDSESVIEAIRHNQSLLQSGQVRIEKRRFYTEHGEQWMLDLQEALRKDNATMALNQDNQDAIFIFDRRKIYFEVQHIGPSLIEPYIPGITPSLPDECSEILFFNGEISTHVQDNLTGNRRHPVWAHIFSGYRRDDLADRPYLDPRKWSDMFWYVSFGTHLGENALGVDGNLTEKMTDVEFSLLGMKRVNGADCYQLELTFTKNKGRHVWEISVNPEKGFWPEQIEFYDFIHPKPLERTLIRRAIYHLLQPPKGIWHPEKIVYIFYEDGIPVWEDHVRFFDFEINVDVSDKLRIDIPPGTPIVDHRLGEGQPKVLAP